VQSGAIHMEITVLHAHGWSVSRLARALPPMSGSQHSMTAIVRHRAVIQTTHCNGLIPLTEAGQKAPGL
jgi:hypothetical protein